MGKVLESCLISRHLFISGFKKEYVFKELELKRTFFGLLWGSLVIYLKSSLKMADLSGNRFLLSHD